MLRIPDLTVQANFRATRKVAGISDIRSKDRFLYFLEQKYSFDRVSDKNPYAVLHLRATMVDRSRADIVVYSNGTVALSSRPGASSTSFEGLLKDIDELSKLSVKTSIRSLAFSRATDLIEFVKRLDTSNDLKRMVAVILSDTANEIVLREKLRSLRVEGPPLDEGIPDKIKRIESKGEPVYRKNEVIDVRKLRNDVAHEGTIPGKKETDRVIEISADFLEKA